ncbi:MAG: hypothetical protein JWO58_879 [Chitinophagaceae bacterium]|nr:hypothetical protein [Chitinophagaceae bacterium]
MKKLFFLLLLCIGMTNAYAQTNQSKSPMTAEQKADEAVTKLKTELALTDDQVTKVKAITVEKINKVTAAHKKNGADKSRLNSANKQIYDEWEAKLKGILTEEQYSKYLASKGQ